MSKTTVLYKDVAPMAQKDASLSTSSATSFSDVSVLPEGITTQPPVTLEANLWLLNGRHLIVENQKWAFWSQDLSDENGYFVSQPVITIAFSMQHSSVGLTLTFDKAMDEYCSEINVKWYQGSTLKADANFSPKSSLYFCEQRVTSYDKIVITLIRTGLPYRYAKLEQIAFGIFRSFGMSELRSASVVNETNLASIELPVSTMRWTLDSDDDVDFMFQLKQAVEVQNNDKLLGVYYIDEHSRTGPAIYNISCYDALGVLDETPFVGGVYSGKSAKALMTEIVGDTFELEFDEGLEDFSPTGVILPGTKRDAIQQIAFAWGVAISTAGRESIRVFTPGDDAAIIGEDRTFFGVSVKTASVVTSVSVTAHSYAESTDGDIEIGGVKYTDTKTVYTVKNPNVTASDKQNAVEITEATLVSSDIGQSVAQRVYDYYLRRVTNRASIVWDGETPGDCVTQPNAWGGTNTGNITKMEIKLSNTVVASCETVGQ